MIFWYFYPTDNNEKWDGFRRNPQNVSYFSGDVLYLKVIRTSLFPSIRGKSFWPYTVGESGFLFWDPPVAKRPNTEGCGPHSPIAMTLGRYGYWGFMGGSKRGRNSKTCKVWAHWSFVVPQGYLMNFNATNDLLRTPRYGRRGTRFFSFFFFFKRI